MNTGNRARFRFSLALLAVVLAVGAMGQPGWGIPQDSAAAATSGSVSVVPRLINFSGAVTDPKGQPVTGQVTLVFSLYTLQDGGSPLWTESQKLQLDDQGHYTVLLGATQPDGLPLDLFTSGQAQWLGVQPQLPGYGEQSRVLLVGMPYALKAADADTIGGLPPSAFVMAAPQTAASAGQNSTSSSPAPDGSATSASAPPPAGITGSGKANTIAMFTGTTTLGNSLISQNGIGTAVNVSGFLQLVTTGTATSSSGFNSWPYDSFASTFNSNTHAAVPQHFRWQAEPLNNNTANPSGKYNFLYAAGNNAPVETGLSLASNGKITFASGQLFPGAGTVTSVASGAGLTGGPITGSGTLSIASAGVTNTMLQHSSLTLTAGTGLTGGGAISLGGAATLSLATASCPAGSAAVALPLGCSPFASLGANNFSGNQTVTGNLSASNEVSAGSAPTGNVASGTVEVDAAAKNSGSYSPGLNFGGGGEAIASNRTTFTDQYGLDFYTNYTKRMTINNFGIVGIGIDPGGYQLEVQGADNTRIEGAAFFGANDTGSGEGAAAGMRAAGGYDITNITFNSAGRGGWLIGGSSNVGFGGDGLDSWAGTGPLANGYAGFFDGDVWVAGNLSKSSGSFKIDDPLDPANKYLYHSFVESPDMMNIYNGNVLLDTSGEAVVELPNWFSALNKDYRYQLTCIGGFAPVYIAEEISNNHFKIAGGKSGMKVSWTVTGVRQDAWANAHRIPVEIDKPEREQGSYIHPELYGAPPEKSVEWARHPEDMKSMKADRAKHLSMAQGKKQ